MPTRHAAPIAGRDTQRPHVDQLLHNLPARHREIIVETYFRRRTTREAARLLGQTPEAASIRLYQAMRDLSDLLTADRPRRRRQHRLADAGRRHRMYR